ncbi:MAG: hypothetical protein LBN06_02480 [Prevotellaceae bacterium]|jgi:hypothetical protein|nr:hypothetical protein [Prevotellaceae bacterium]
MNVLPYIIPQPLLIEVEVRSDDYHTKPSGAFEKLKHRPVILYITGEGVLSKHYPTEDVARKKITENKELLWSVTSSGKDSEGVTVSFMRRERIAPLLEELDRYAVPILEQHIASTHLSAGELSPGEALKRAFALSNLRRKPEQLNLLCRLLYHRLQLPVLLLFLVLLLGNFLLSERWRRENNLLQTELSARQRNDKLQKESREKQGRISNEYRKVPSVSFALLSDRIASYVPEEVRLNRLSLFPATSSGSLIGRDKEVKLSFGIIHLTGETTIPGSATLFSRFLSNDPLFDSVKVVSLERQKDSPLFQFELHLKIKS